MKLLRLNYFVILVTIILLLVNASSAFAVTANPNPVKFTQPDGSVLTIILKGDEFIHWAETSDHFTLLSNKNGAYEYAIMDSRGRLGFSGVQAHDSDTRNQSELAFLNTVNKGLFFSRAQITEMKELLKNSKAPSAPLTGGFPHTGTRARLTILANFSNTTTTYTQSNFDNMMNQVGYNSTGSFKDFFIEVSYGQLTVNTTVTVWVTLPNTHDFYGPNAEWGQFALDAVTAANNQAGVNYANFDNDGDGFVDGVCIIHQGRGQEESGNTNDIWSHSWDLTSAGFTAAQCTFDGVRVDAYTAQPEKGGSTAISTVGVMCHEFGHNLGAADYYDSDYTTGGSYDGTGDWDLMAGGSWNTVTNAGDKPAHPNAYCKAYDYGWTVPVVLTTSQNKVLRNAETYPDVVRYNTTTSNEYFLCENRQLNGFDVALPGHGMIIYHVDGAYIVAHSGTNDINAGAHQGLYPVCASATGNPTTTYGTINGGGCPYPGTSSKTTFTDATTPHSHSWAGANTNYPLLNITENNTTKEISFCFISCASPDDPTNFTATAASSSQINLSWGHNASNSNVMVAFNTSSTFGTPVAGTSYSAGNAIAGGGTVIYNGANLAYNHTALLPNTTYYYKAWSVLTGVTYSTGVVSNATTLCGVSTLPLTENFTAATMPSCWTTQFSGTGAVNSWSVSNTANAGGAAYEMVSTYQSVSSGITRLVTVPINTTGMTSLTLSFKHMLDAYSTGCTLKVQSSTDGVNWTNEAWSVATTASNIIATTVNTTVVNNLNSANTMIAFTAEGNLYNYDYWYIDNISVTGVSSLATVTTTTPSAVTTTAASAGGTVSSIGGSAVTARGVCWATTANPTIANSLTTDGSGLGTYTSSITGLIANTLYHVRAYATNSSGTAYGSDVSFTTCSSMTPVSVLVAASSNPVCANTSVTFTATPANGGNPTYQWYKNGVATGTGSTYSYVPVTGDQVYVVMTSTLSCTSGSPATSNTITMTVNPILPVSVSIAASSNPVCAGTAVTFTPTPVNGGTAAYQWYKNSVPVSTASTYSYTPVNSDQVYVVMTSSLSCKSGSPATSNTVTMTVNPALNAGIAISATSNPACAGTSVTFNATPTNGGSTPAYQWKKNGVAVGTNSSSYSYVPANSDIMTCVLTSNATCVSGSPATSNAVTMTVNPILPVGISIQASSNPVVAGTSVTFTATPANGGSSPVYQWKVNGSNVGSGSSSYTYIPINGDVVSCILTSNATCVSGNPATSGSIGMTVNPLQLTVTPSNMDVPSTSGSVSYTVTSNTSWAVISNQSWCTVTPSGTGNGSIIANFATNSTGLQRVANITITSSGLTPVVVTLTQSDGLFKTLNLTLYLESLFNGTVMNPAQDFVSGSPVPKFGNTIADQVTIELHNSQSPYAAANIFYNLYLQTNGTLSIGAIPSSVSGSYYIVVKNRNSVETWSKLPVSFSASTISYNFTTAATQAYGNNLKLMNAKWVIYGGDINQDGIVDGTDLAGIDNASTLLLTGYIAQDANGDGVADGSDMALIDNNSTWIIQVQRP